MNKEEDLMSSGRMRKLLLLFLTVSLLAGLSCSKAEYPEGLYAELHTNKGLIVLSLEFDKTPMTVAHFIGLTEGRIDNDALPEGVPFYDGTKFHRVVPGHVIQAGAPVTEGDGRLGYMFPNEIHPDLSHNRAGMVGVANGGPHTNGSQFYITLGDRSYLDGDYTVFGEVIQGMDVISKIIQGDVIKTIRIIRIGKQAKRFRSDTQAFLDLKLRVQNRVKEQAEKKEIEESATIDERWPEAVEEESGSRYVIIQEGEGETARTGNKIRVRYTGEVLEGQKFFSTVDGNPSDEQPAEEFIMELGKNRVNSGLDQALNQMREGEKRILILPSRLAYGTGGFYAKERKGKKRFVISPNSTLVYEVELLGIVF
jgi:cyclophilin family peptidyl-prolyl cis-trans isomerase